MKLKKMLVLALSCLLIAETPLISQAAPSTFKAFPLQADIQSQTDLSLQEEEPICRNPASQANQEDAPLSMDTSTREENPAVSAPSSPEDNPLSKDTSVPVDGSASEGCLPQADPGTLEDIISKPDSGNAAEPGTESDGSLLVYLERDTYKMNIGDSFRLEVYTDLPADITWSSDQEGIASVSDDGTVTATGIGTAVITATGVATTEDGTFTGAASCEITVGNTITFEQDHITLYLGQTQKLSVSLPVQEEITWTSSAPDTASVSTSGAVTSKKAGTATITATTASGATAFCRVTVKNPELKLKSSATAYLKSTLLLKAEAFPAGKITWKSSDPKVATVNSKGQVKPKKKGTTTITATCNGISKKCKVTVKKPSLKLKTKSAVLFEGSAFRPEVTAKPANSLKWKSSRPKIASVNANGEIVGKKPGTATLTASLLGKKASCKVRVIKDKHKLSRTSATIMKGQSISLRLSNLSSNESVYFRLSGDSWPYAGISTSGNTCEVTGIETGTAILQAIYTSYQDGQSVTGVSECRIKVVDRGISQQQVSLAVKTKKELTLKNVEKEGLSLLHTTWESSKPKVAEINGNGVVTGKASGTAKITATATYSDHSKETFTTTLKVSNPRLKRSSSVLTVGSSKKLKLSGTNSYSSIQWKIRKTSLATVSQDGTVTSKYSTGSTAITLVVDGKTIKHKLKITNPRLKSSYQALTPGKTAQITVKGASSKQNITYKSKNKSVATVSKTGRITAKSYGNAEITVKADGASMAFYVSVAPQRALSACTIGHQIMYSSTYSQARRMQQGFYDCSSLVFRAYGSDAGLLGGSPFYAPTAAAMAHYLERTGKAVSSKALDASKLLPGDLIFYGSPSSPNGRYKNIYHVSMYYGNGQRLEHPLRNYYPVDTIVLIARPVR
ncbi:Ig-like domain-containing protein [Lachnospiraceae bacterium 29-84]